MKKPETIEKTFLDILTETLTLKRETLHQPDADIEPGEKVVGTLEDEQVRALFSLRAMLQQHLVKFKKSFPERRPNDDEVRRLTVRANALATQYKIANCLLWEGVHTEFPATRDPRVACGIRKGWVVVIFKNPPSNPLAELLQGLLE